MVRSGSTIKKSSIWAGLKFGGHSGKKTQWALYDGKRVDFWRHNWAGDRPLQRALNLSNAMLKGCKVNIEEFCNEGRLTWPEYVVDFLEEAGLGIENIYEAKHCDTLYWLPDTNGEFTVSLA